MSLADSPSPSPKGRGDRNPKKTTGMNTSAHHLSHANRWHIILPAIVLLCAGCRRPVEETLTGPTMGTQFTVKVVRHPGAVELAILEKEIQAELDRVDALMSTYRADSELSRFNAFDRTEWFPVSAATAEVVATAIDIGRLSGGAFDVTVGPLVNLWGFGPSKEPAERVPSPEEIEEAKNRTGLDHIEVRLSPPAVRKDLPGVSIDLSGVAKGFAVDQVAGLLERRGLENYMVEVGGEVRTKGQNLQGRPWQIGIESPVAGVRSLQRVVGLGDDAMATSGDYRNYFEADGVRYSHMIDPRTGRPIAHRLASVTVLDRYCTRADAWATALMVLGPEEGYALAEKEDLPVLLVIKSDAGFVEKATPKFEKLLQ